MTVQNSCLTLVWDTIGWDNISPDVQILGIDLSPVGEKNMIFSRRESNKRPSDKKTYIPSIEPHTQLLSVVWKAQI